MIASIRGTGLGGIRGFPPGTTGVSSLRLFWTRRLIARRDISDVAAVYSAPAPERIMLLSP